MAASALLVALAPLLKNTAWSRYGHTLEPLVETLRQWPTTTLEEGQAWIEMFQDWGALSVFEPEVIEVLEERFGAALWTTPNPRGLWPFQWLVEAVSKPTSSSFSAPSVENGLVSLVGRLPAAAWEASDRAAWLARHIQEWLTRPQVTDRHRCALIEAVLPLQWIPLSALWQGQPLATALRHDRDVPAWLAGGAEPEALLPDGSKRIWEAVVALNPRLHTVLQPHVKALATAPPAGDYEAYGESLIRLTRVSRVSRDTWWSTLQSMPHWDRWRSPEDRLLALHYAIIQSPALLRLVVDAGQTDPVWRARLAERDEFGRNIWNILPHRDVATSASLTPAVLQTLKAWVPLAEQPPLLNTHFNQVRPLDWSHTLGGTRLGQDAEIARPEVWLGTPDDQRMLLAQWNRGHARSSMHDVLLGLGEPFRAAMLPEWRGAIVLRALNKAMRGTNNADNLVKSPLVESLLTLPLALQMTEGKWQEQRAKWQTDLARPSPQVSPETRAAFAVFDQRVASGYQARHIQEQARRIDAPASRSTLRPGHQRRA